MYDNEPNRESRRSKRLVGAVGLRLAGGIAGGSLAATSSALAAEKRPRRWPCRWARQPQKGRGAQPIPPRLCAPKRRR